MNVPGIIAIGVLTLLAVALLIGWYELRRATRAEPSDPPPPPDPSGIERLVRDQIVVTMKTGETFSGVLWEETPREIVLRGAAGIGMADKRENLPVDGELLIFVSDIAYVQKP